MGFRAAFKQLVVLPLRELASEEGTQTYRLVHELEARNEDGELNRDADGRVVYEEDSFGNAHYDHRITKWAAHGQKCYGSLEEVLLYSYAYMPMHFTLFKKVVKTGGGIASILRKQIADSDGDLLLIDVGSGPLTAGLAIADWYVDTFDEPLSLTYVAIDQSEHCLEKAVDFSKRDDLFSLNRPLKKYTDLDACKPKNLAKYVSEDGTVVFLFSYLFGQDGCSTEDLKKLAAFISKVVQACHPARCFMIYTNTTYDGKQDTNESIEFSKRH